MPNSCCDLHLHTYYSDGRASPAEILRYAASLGLKTVAITDHDNLNSYLEASHVSKSLGLELVPAVEFTSRWDECQAAGGFTQDVDILGYYLDPNYPALQNFLAQAMEDLRQRINDCCYRLTQAGFPLTLYEVLEENPRYPGTMQVVSALWHKGYGESWGAVYPIFAEQWPQVRAAGFTVQAVIEAIHSAGGAAILAHPIAINCRGSWLQANEVAALAAWGLDGLEVYHPRMDEEARQHFLTLASQHNLLVTGGSDEHGWGNGFPRLGSELVTYEMVNNLRKRAHEWAAQRI